MPDFDIQVEFMNVSGKDEKDAIDRLAASLYHMYPVCSEGTDVDWLMIDAIEVKECDIIIDNDDWPGAHWCRTHNQVGCKRR